jgi:hypothetical protein
LYISYGSQNQLLLISDMFPVTNELIFIHYLEKCPVLRHRNLENRRKRRQWNSVLGVTTLPRGAIDTETWSSRLGVGRKGDDLALYKHYCCEIQRNGNQMV